MGLVDFDVLDGVEEFIDAGSSAGLRVAAGLETRVFVEDFADRVINSPGEPGISYHMGAGFVGGPVAEPGLLDRLKAIAQDRTRGMMDRISAHLDPVRLDYEADVVPLTPKNNPTERHVCGAFDQKAKQVFPEREARIAFWAARLGLKTDQVAACLDDAPVLQGLIRSKTMKAGGVGYVQPEGQDFPKLEEVNAFTVANGAIPTFAFLDGTSPGEKCMEELLDLMMASGAAMANIIPDRNWNIKDPIQRAVKVAKLDAFIHMAANRDLPIIVGTEMNAYGQRFVDDFEADALKPHYPRFLEGAHIIHAHTLLQAWAGMGYLSDWAKDAFPDTKAKNRFFAALGAHVATRQHPGLGELTAEASPEGVAQALGFTFA